MEANSHAASQAVMVERLNRLLADASVLYQKMRHYHWNVTGPHFFTLHAQFEALYTNWALTIDALAERIRAIGGVPLHTMAEVLEVAQLDEDPSLARAEVMVQRLASDLEVMQADVTDALELASTTSPGTAEMLSALLDQLEKDLWMLGAWLHEVRADEVPRPYMSPD